MTATEATPARDLTDLYTPGQIDVITELSRIQAETGKNDGKFAADHLTVHGTTWMRIREGTYAAADPSAALIKLETNLRNIRLERAKASKLTGGAAFVRIPWQEAVKNAVTLAKLKPTEDCERLVVGLGETGAGKTALGRQLKIEHDGVLVEASEPWRTSYFAALFDIGLELGISEADLGNSAATAQRAVLKKLKVNRRVLVIDEGEYFGPAVTNLVKLLLNKTATVIVILAIPALYTRWQKSAWVESAQTSRRSEAVVMADAVFPDDVIAVAKTMKLDLDKAGAGQIAKAANEFGRLSLVKRVLKGLEGETDEETVIQSIRNAKALLRREEVAK